MAFEGIKLFNQGEYWLAHEALENAWLEEAGIIRGLYKGILQVGVMYLQIERKNFRGAMKMHKRAMVWLTPWPKRCRGVEIGKLREDVDIVYQAVLQLGLDQLENFDLDLFKPIDFTYDR